MAQKIILGNIPSSIKKVVRKPGSVAAGIAVKLDTDGSVAVGKTYGISLGETLDGVAGEQAVAVDGYDIFVVAATGFTATSKVGTPLYLDDDGKACDSDAANATLVNAIIEDTGAEAYDPSDLFNASSSKKTGVLVRINGGL